MRVFDVIAHRSRKPKTDACRAAPSCGGRRLIGASVSNAGSCVRPDEPDSQRKAAIIARGARFSDWGMRDRGARRAAERPPSPGRASGGPARRQAAAARHRRAPPNRRPPDRRCRYGAGFGCCSWSASISARISGASFTSTLATFSRNCASDVAPIRLLVTNGRLLTNASASWAGDNPCRLASAT